MTAEVPGYAVRRGRWKGIVPHCSQNDTLEPHVSDSMMLFDLDSDPSETTDVSSVHADVVASLKQLVISESLSCQCYQGPCRGTQGSWSVTWEQLALCRACVDSQACTMALTFAFFLVYLLHALLRSTVELFGGIPGAVRHGHDASSVRECVLGWEQCLKICTYTVNLAPMLCILFMAARMRALQIDPRSGRPQWWAESCFYWCTASVIAHVLIVFLAQVAGIQPEMSPAVQACLLPLGLRPAGRRSSDDKLGLSPPPVPSSPQESRLALLAVCARAREFDPAGVERGTKGWGYVSVVNDLAARVDMPVMVINGIADGPTMAVTAGLYPLEYCGIEAAGRLYAQVDPEHLSGKLVIVPVDINDLFPGDPKGTVSDVLAHKLFTDVILAADAHVDLRGGEVTESHLMHTIYLEGFGNLTTTVKEMASLFGLPYLIYEPEYRRPGPLIYEAMARGIPSIVSESGLGYNPQPGEKQVLGHVVGVTNLMTHLKMVDGNVTHPDRQHFLLPERVEVQVSVGVHIGIGGVSVEVLVGVGGVSAGLSVGVVASLSGSAGSLSWSPSGIASVLSVICSELRACELVPATGPEVSEAQCFNAAAGARRPHLPRPLALLLACAAVPAEPRVALQVEYGLSMQPLVWARVGAQRLQLVFDSSSADMLVFVGEEGACSDRYKRPCYSFRAGLAGGTLRFCQDSSNCDQLLESVECKNTTSKPHFKKSNQGDLSICGLLYHERSVEALEEVEIELQGTAAGQAAWRDAPARLLVEPLQASAPDRGPPGYMLGLFEGAGGMLGAAGPTLSCRNDSAWKRLLQHLNATGFVLDLQPPPHAWAPPGRDPPPASSFWEAAALEAADEQPSGEVTCVVDVGHGRFRTSASLLGDGFACASREKTIDGQEGAAWPEGLVWSQPKTGGEPFNDALHTFLMFHPTVCGVELLRNVSSHWLVIIDTSGPCLTLPPFIFDSVRAHVPMDCPFEVGEMARGRLCSPRREFTGSTSLPSLRFQLDPPPPCPP
ncbi:unnamed protein product [Prorocentrum cordatum]|uniref:Uncharacterized protein n=1 Tax=Prorocentrum cordatum TaxID=2364126 RepID=A0ABN9PJI1_9DINO|nr:unnamed protein product [Polarella glacialis]